MESSPKKIPRNKVPALVLVLLALVVMVFVIWRVDSAPSTNDAYASADTIDVVPEVSGRIVELAVADNQQVKKAIFCSVSTPVPTKPVSLRRKPRSPRWINRLC